MNEYRVLVFDLVEERCRWVLFVHVDGVGYGREHVAAVRVHNARREDHVAVFEVCYFKRERKNDYEINSID